ncbi:hypothetical protein COA17_05750 [Sphingomonas ginsenosidimutans]|uniref:STAS/SEC14 domain-containing protein n=1 Tax=Sphingomonas ginsenosidimutans TaxID=862134 RepID=A0A2A4HXZ8_9SPHN|nr:hypothetical protein [Sphingomonas ginsenosidimutans]PCG09396.1 hypothetical protein COA17_05750 [Sphingomonas ginsenosidimutans]
MSIDAYSINVDPSRHLVDIAVRGLWTVETVSRYRTDIAQVIGTLRAHGCAVGQHLTLLDITGFIVQVQEVTALLAGMAAEPEFATRCAAIVVEAPLLRMQARRVLPHYGVFAERGPALEWLLSDRPAAPE